MSHHVTATATNPSGAVETVHVHAATVSAPIDGGSALAPAVAGAGGLPRTGATQVAGASGTPGANLPVENIEQASNTIQRGRADLSQTVGAERRLDGFDGVGGGGGGGGAAAGGANANANNATGAVAQGTNGENVSDQQGGLAAQATDTTKSAGQIALPDKDIRA